MKNLPWVMDVFAIWIVVMVSFVYTYITPYHIAHFKIYIYYVYDVSIKLLFKKEIIPPIS